MAAGGNDAKNLGKAKFAGSKISSELKLQIQVAAEVYFASVRSATNVAGTTKVTSVESGAFPSVECCRRWYRNCRGIPQWTD